MSGIYIPIFEMPRDGVYRMGLVVKDGTATVGFVREESFADKTIEWFQCVPLSDHGDLIDESEKVEAQYYDEEFEEWSIKTKTVGDVLAEICEVPPKVVIPAEMSEG